jgi:RimJ/RimL family protein N-acetyltransferase/nitrite reductase/ring-hydroxylating ferredoxin subunit
MPEPIRLPSPGLNDGTIALRSFRLDDVAAITAACQDPEIQRWIPMLPVPYTQIDALRYVEMTLQAQAEGSSAEVAIVDQASDRLLGSIGIRMGDGPRRASIGYWVAPEARGRGVATRALRLMVRWGFERLRIERLALWTVPGNRASHLVAQKVGFRYEGLARNWEADREGQPVDCVMYSLTPDDATQGDAPDDPRLAPVPAGLAAPGTRTAPFFDLMAVAELAPGSMRRLTLADEDLLVAWTTAGIVVTDDRCPHMAAPLSIGGLEGCVAACPLHEGRFDLSTGETDTMPTTGGLDADGGYQAPRLPSGVAPASTPPSEPPARKAEARRLTRVRRLRYYPTRILEGRLEAQVPILPE